ncbi:MAG: hypothetical protein IH994_01245 [Proteobacteria bacterium]|nr:hypothetical protein [Pseudomonadota bacterium]
MPTLDQLEPPDPHLDLPEEDWRKIETALGLKKPDPWFRNKLANHVLLYVKWPEPQLDRVRPSHLRKSIKKILKDAESLRTYLVFENDEEEQDDPQEWARAVVVYRLLSLHDTGTLVSSLEGTIKTMEGALASLPPDKGGRRHDALYGLVHVLALDYLEATGKPPTVTFDPRGNQYRSPFLDFVEAVLKVFAPQLIKGNLALGKATQRALKDWRTRMGMDKT